MPRDLTRREQLQESVTVLKSLKSTYERQCDSASAGKVRAGLETRVQAAKRALDDFNAEQLSAPAKLAATTRELEEAQRQLAIEENEDMKRLVEKLKQAKQLQDELEKTPEGRNQLRLIGVLVPASFPPHAKVGDEYEEDDVKYRLQPMMEAGGVLAWVVKNV